MHERWISRWIDSTDEWMDGLMVVWMDGHGEMDIGISRRMDGWMNDN